MPLVASLPCLVSLAAAGGWPGDCLADVQALVIDGANRICAVSSARPIPVALAAAALIACAWLLVRGGGVARRALPAVAIACALPGWWAVLFVRADAPHQAAATARLIRRPLDRYRAFAGRHRCVDLIANACVACQPLAQLAFEPCEGRSEGAAQASLGPGAFSGACTESDTTLRCP